MSSASLIASLTVRTGVASFGSAAFLAAIRTCFIVLCISKVKEAVELSVVPRYGPQSLPDVTRLPLMSSLANCPVNCAVDNFMAPPLSMVCS